MARRTQLTKTSLIAGVVLIALAAWPLHGTAASVAGVLGVGNLIAAFLYATEPIRARLRRRR